LSAGSGLGGCCGCAFWSDIGSSLYVIDSALRLFNPPGRDAVAVRTDLPTGTVTFFFTDAEGSTKLLHDLGAERYADALTEHQRVVREACGAHDGVEVDTQGDAFFVAFPAAAGALAAAAEIAKGVAAGPIRVRIGLHTGTPLVTGEGYVGDDVHLAARVAASGHGGQILVSAATAARVAQSGSEPQALSLLDLGEHRLKDIEGAVSIFQLGDSSFPPLRTISNTNLPRPASSFVGRERELEGVLAGIAGGVRLLTLTGPGGSGKTRLAIEAAASLLPEYRAGVFWVGLAALRDPALVTETISRALGARDGLPEHIGERELLVLLDNLEQVIAAAPELSALLSACPNLTLIVTSRELLRVQGEVEFAVPPLAETDAVALFCERAHVKPSEEIAELCVHLDSQPLAVELAAARAKALSTAQILARLWQRLDLLKGGRDADPRHQTLRATIEWSYDLLSDDEKQLFRRHGHLAEVREWAEAALDARDRLSGRGLAETLVGGGEIARFAGDLSRAIELKEELASVQGDLRRPNWKAATLADLCEIALDQRDFARARSYAAQSAAAGGGARAALCFAELALRVGDLGSAESNGLAALADLEEGAFNHACALEMLGETARRSGDAALPRPLL